MASSEAFVDASYRGLDAGRRLKLTDLGPETGYLEMARPLPVGAQLALATDEGCELRVVVLRVHEQVAGSDLPPGVRVRLEDGEGDAASWWSSRASRQDPPIPAPPPPPKARPLPIDTVGVPADYVPETPTEPATEDADTTAPQAGSDPAPATDGEPASPTDGEPASPTDGEPASAADGEPASAADGEPASTSDSDSASSTGSDPTPSTGNGERKKRKRNRRRRR